MQRQDPAVEGEAFYDRVGGHETFRTLIREFFVEVRADPDVRPVYPPDDWEGAEHRLLIFFEQYWGGPHGYSRERGAPMLKMRHMPFKITESVARSWVGCMDRALRTITLGAEDEVLMRDYVVRAAIYLINADE